MKKLSTKFRGKCSEGAGGQEDEQGPAAGPCCKGSKGNSQLHWVYCQVREMIFISAQLFQATSEVLFHFWAPHCKGHMDIMKRVQRKGHKEESGSGASLPELGLVILEEKSWRGILFIPKIQEGRVQTWSQALSSGCPVPGADAMGTHWNTRGSLWTSTLSSTAIPWLSDSRCWQLEKTGNTVAWTSQTSSNNGVIKFAASHRFH